MKVLVAGASGFVGSRLCPSLVEAGHEVVAMTRHPDTYAGSGTAVHGDVHDADTVHAALEGCAAAYYLVHSLDAQDFETRDAEAAGTFGRAAATAGLSRIVYLGGLGDDSDALSAHLRSRRQIETVLGDAGVAVTSLRAGIIVGHGGISWELTRQLVEHLPAMVTPKWVHTRTQPIAIGDVVRYLVAVLELPQAGSRALEIGGPDVLQYVTMLRRVAAIKGRPLLVVPVPLLTPQLSSLWLSLVTDVDTMTGRALVDSMSNEVVVRDDAIRTLIPFELTSYDDAVRQALREQAELGGTEDKGAATDPDTDPAAGPAADSTTDRRRSEERQVNDVERTWSDVRRTVVGSLPRPFREQVPAPHIESDEVRGRRRRAVTAFGVAGAGLLAVSMSAEPGSKRFYWLTAGLAATWTSGALVSGPLHLGRIHGRDDTARRPIITPVATGAAAFGAFYGAALVSRRIPVLDEAIGSVLRFADQGSTPLVVLTSCANGVAEELFFRGPLFEVLAAQHPVLRSTVAYTAATVATRNPALVLAAAVMGALFGLQRKASGGIQASALTHVTWSVLMLRYLPPLFRRATRHEKAHD